MHQSKITSVPLETRGQVFALSSGLIRASLPYAALGDLCYLTARDGASIPAEVVGFQREECALAPFEDPSGITPGSLVLSRAKKVHLNYTFHPNDNVSLRNYLGETLPDTSSDSDNSTPLPLHRKPLSPLERTSISERMTTGCSAIDVFCPIGFGQRIGLLAGPGVGKSTLLGMLAAHSNADRIVVALVGERGREVLEFYEKCTSTAIANKTTIVATTSDESPIRKKIAVMSATAIAEYHRAQGEKVLLLVDSLTRMARAIRDLGLASGELPVRHGFTPSVYSELPKLIERAGKTSAGSITALYTLLTNDNGELDPLSHELKSLLDGHITLSPEIAASGVFPAVDSRKTLSRLERQLLTDEQQEALRSIRSALHILYEKKDYLLLGGTPDARLQAALNIEEDLQNLFSQPPGEYRDYAETWKSIRDIAQQLQSLS